MVLSAKGLEESEDATAIVSTPKTRRREMAITVASLDLRVSLVFMVRYLLYSHLHLGGLIERVIALHSYGKDSTLECQSHFDKILGHCYRTEHRTKWKIVEC